MFVSDHDLVRHCTASQERLVAPEYFTGNFLGVFPAPLDGLNHDHARYGWPGAITQSIYQAFFADRYGDSLVPPGLKDNYTGAELLDFDSKDTSKYQISQLSFDPVSDDGTTWYPPLIVKPCPLLQSGLQTDALNRIAHQALMTYAHYRFYAFSKGNIGGDLNYGSPQPFTVPAAQPAFDYTTGRWADWSSEIKWVTEGTIAACCSSFVWQLIKNVFPENKSPVFQLDWADIGDTVSALGEENGRCVRTIPPNWDADSAYGLQREDGLYFYSEEERKVTAQSLHDNLFWTVYESLKSALQKSGGIETTVGQLLDDVGRADFIVAAQAGVNPLLALLTPLLGAAAADVDAVFIEKLIELLYDTPEDVANQMCNLFAFDCGEGAPADGNCVDAAGNLITDIDSDNWSSAPGNGLAVSPDNIHMFWDAPGIWDGDVAFGLYGYNVPAALCVGVFNKPICALVPSTGTAEISGLVRYKRLPVTGAYVSAGCETTTSTGNGYALQVRSGGQYKLIARYDDPKTGLTLYGEATTGGAKDTPIQPNAKLWREISLIEPPDNMREVVVQGTISCDDVSLTGTETKAKSFKQSLHVQYGVAVFVFDEATGTGAWKIDEAGGTQRQTDHTVWFYSVGDAKAELHIDVQVNRDLSVKVTVEGIINDGERSTGPGVFHVAKDATISITDGFVDTGGTFPDRANFRGITIYNGVSAI